MRSIVLSCAAFTVLVSAGAAARADDFLQQEGDMWRASKLVGVNIYGTDNKKVGDVSDVLMGKNGKAAYVVVGVGGFLGLGQKDVAIPFDKVKFSQEPMPMPAASANPPAATNAPAGTMAPANNAAANPPTGLGTPATTDGTGMAPAAPATGGAMATPAARSTAYPDHGTIDYTVDALKSAPTFTYAK